jgi:hypothetical protein
MLHSGRIQLCSQTSDLGGSGRQWPTQLHTITVVRISAVKSYIIIQSREPYLVDQIIETIPQLRLLTINIKLAHLWNANKKTTVVKMWQLLGSVLY